MIRLFKRRKTVTLRVYALMSKEEKEFIDYTLKHSLKPNPILRLGRKKIKPKQLDFWKLSGNDILFLRHHLGRKDIKAIHKLIYNVDDEDFLRLDVFNCSACYRWVVDQIKSINEIENEELGGEPSIEDKAAGIERLGEFGYAVWVHQLSKGDLTKEEEILKLPYSKLFRKRCLIRTLSEINEQKQENARRKAKRNRR